MTDAEERARREELSNIALAAAKEAVRETMTETFALLGINLANFSDVQEFRKDLEFAASMRRSTQRVGARFGLAFVTVVAGGIAIGAWEYLKFLVARY